MGEERFQVIIAGSRGFNDFELLTRKCDYVFSRRHPTCIITGGARGADTLGKRYATLRKIPSTVIPAKWSYGKLAGYQRNEEMLKQADALIAFWDGHSHGTSHMIRIAKEKKIPVRVIYV